MSSSEGRAGLEPARWYLTGTCSAAELPTQSKGKSALRESNPPTRFGRPVPLPLGQGHSVYQSRICYSTSSANRHQQSWICESTSSANPLCQRKERESNPQGCYAQPFSRRTPSPVGLPFRLAAEAGIEPATRRLTAAFPYQYRTHRIICLATALAQASSLSLGGLRLLVRMAGFEPAVSCSRRTRNARLSHTLM